MTQREEAELAVIHRHLDERTDGMKLELLESGISKADHDQFLYERNASSNMPQSISFVETDTVHVFVVRPLSTVDIMFNWKYA